MSLLNKYMVTIRETREDDIEILAVSKTHVKEIVLALKEQSDSINNKGIDSSGESYSAINERVDFEIVKINQFN